MIKYVTGDLLKDESEAVVNTVNCVGVMGRGIALQFKKAYPANFKSYAAACKQGDVQPGRMFVFDRGSIIMPRYIINFPTKRHWRGKSRIEDIETGLADLVRVVEERGITSIAIPPLGSGLGGLDWADVRMRIEEVLGALPSVAVRVYEPRTTPLDRPVRNREVPKITAGRATLIALMDRYLGGLLDPFVTLIEVYKLTYFAQEAGENLRLQFSKGRYGPYPENLRHVLNKIEGHMISGFADGGEAPTKRLELVPGARADAYSYLENKPQTRAHLSRVTDLIGGFETPYGMELLATVHWLAKENTEGALSVSQLVEQTHAWNDRKRRFTPRQIGIAADALAEKGWIALA